MSFQYLLEAPGRGCLSSLLIASLHIPRNQNIKTGNLFISPAGLMMSVAMSNGQRPSLTLHGHKISKSIRKPLQCPYQ